MKAACVLVACLSMVVACTPDFGEENQAPVLIRITDIEGESGGGGAGSGVGTVLNSDVSFEGSIFNDNATLNVANISKNQNPALGPNRLNDVILERYEVQYVRSDGRDQEGVDVPYRITGPVNSLVPVDESADVPIVIVRHQAKAEPPLRNLVGGFGGALVLTTAARITIHGRTISGKAVQAQGQMQITFADFGDE
jgi:hypothetical protein